MFVFLSLSKDLLNDLRNCSFALITIRIPLKDFLRLFRKIQLLLSSLLLHIKQIQGIEL